RWGRGSRGTGHVDHDGDEIEQNREDRGPDRGHEQLADRGFGQQGVDDDRARARRHDRPERTAGGAAAGGERRRVAAGAHLRNGNAADGGGGRPGTPGDGPLTRGAAGGRGGPSPAVLAGALVAV